MVSQRTAELPWGYGLEEWERYGVRYPIRLPLSSHCHALVTGGSGSGKSFALLWLTGRLLKSSPDIRLVFCDFKNSDEFRFLSPYAHYYAGDACYQGIMDYYGSFTEARKSASAPCRHLLVCDEYQAMVNYYLAKDKREKTKLANDLLSAVAEILMLGRGLKYSVWIVTQRASSELFSQGSRDNFQVILALGRLSKEQRAMLFSGETLPDRTIYTAGEGLLLADGREVKEVKFPLVKDVAGWERHILELLRRPPGA